MKKSRTKEVPKSDHHGYLKTAKEYVEGAKDHYAKERYIATCGDCVHGMIAASDALTIYFLGRKSAGQNHMDAINLLRQVAPHDDQLSREMTRFQRVLGLKSAAEYGGGKVDQRDAENALRDAQRFLEFVTNRIR
jgi:uncharacterized protein (UPF0332 family)